MLKKASSFVNLFVALSMIMAMLVVAPLSGAAVAAPDVPPDTKIKDARLAEIPTEVFERMTQESALLKIDPALRAAVEFGGSEMVEVYVSIADGAAIDLTKFLDQAIYRPAVFGGIRNVYGKARVGALLEIASNPGVLAVVATGDTLREKPLASEAVAPDPAELSARLAAMQANEVTWAEAQAAAQDAGAQGWFDVLDGHQSSDAWERGFTGEGVIVGVLDDGIDFAHPDLQGTYAWVTDESSPYYGWPMAFSQVSTEYFVNEVLFQDLGARGITLGWNGSRWSDTSFTVAGPTPSFGGGTGTAMYQPLGASSAFEYTIPASSMSGQYKFGSLHEKNLLAVYGHRVAILVVDENQAGWFDTVYVDLDNDKDFTDEKPVTQDSPEVYRDMDGDGYADVSGGMVAWISDGDNTPPTVDWLWGIGCGDEVGTLKACPDSGSLVIFAGPFDAGYTHGTQCASNIAGQGVVNGGLSDQPFRIGGMVKGAAPNVGLMDFGNHYYSGTDEDEFLVASLGYDGIPYSGDEVQITSNSYGAFTQMWGGFGYIGRLITALNLTIAENTVWVFSAGNEGPGYGPQEGDGGPTTVQVGSSTQYGSTNWDSIAGIDQVVWGDPNTFFSKGPNRDGSSGLDVLANGGRGAGDEGLNYYGFDGWTSWATWGGTSRSAPVAAGNLALLFQAHYDRHDRWPTWEEAKMLLKSSATNTISAPFYQGAGVVNADRGSLLAAGIYGLYAEPTEWMVGDWEGETYLNFPSVAEAGGSYTQEYSVYNPSGYDITANLSDGVMLKTGEYQYEFTTSPQGQESVFNFHSPDYLMELPTEIIPADAELMVVRYVHPYDTYDSNFDFSAPPNSSWRFMLYNWKDINGDGDLWVDADANGVVNHVGNGMYDNDGFERLDFASPETEIQEGEYIRMDYTFGGIAIPVMVRDPLARMQDGYFFGFQHRSNDGTIEQTTFTINVEFYSRADWDWLSLDTTSLAVPAEDMATFNATVDVPVGAEPGIYEGVIFVNDPGNNNYDAHESALPVVVNVIADLPDGGSVSLGGGPMADTLYQNSYTYGYFNWYGGGWTGAGDWRHYFLNLDDADVAKNNLLVNTWWDSGFPTDINTIVLGPTDDCATGGVAGCAWFQPGLGQPDPSVYGPYTLAPIAQSEPFASGATYRFNTTTGGPSDWLLAELETPGLHEIALHNVLYDGETLAAQFGVEVGTFEAETSIDPAVGMAYTYPFYNEVYTNSGEIEIEFTSSLALPGITMTLAADLSTDVFGPFTEFVPDNGQQFNAWDPNNVISPFIVDQTGATELHVMLQTPPAQDPDLFLIYDVNDNGVVEEGVDIVVGSSGNSTGTAEEITVADPALGRYFVAIAGYDMDPDSGVNVDWYYDVTFPGRLPSTAVDLYNQATAIYQDAPFDPTTSSFSMTFTASDRTDGLHIMVTDIITGQGVDVDVYVTTPAGVPVAVAQTRGDGDEHIYLPSEDLPDEVIIWVHGFSVPAAVEPVMPTIHIWEDVTSVWLTSSHPDVTILAIDPGETVSATLHFDAPDWTPADPPINVRVIAGPPMLPTAFDQRFTIDYVGAAPGPAPFFEMDQTYTSERGPSPSFFNTPLGILGGVLFAPGELITQTLTVRNTGDAAGNYYIDAYWGDAALDFHGFGLAPDNAAGYVAGTWEGMEMWGLLDVGAETTIELVLIGANPTPGSGYYVIADLYDLNTFDFFETEAFIAHNRTFLPERLIGFKTSSVDPVHPGETFTYTIELINATAEDVTMFMYDPLPEQVSFVSASPGVTYDAANHMATWSGDIPGTLLNPVVLEITVMLDAATPEGVLLQNTAYVSDKFLGDPLMSATDTTLVDDEMDPDVWVTKTVDSLLSPAGHVLQYTITVMNDGTEDAIDVTIMDEVPELLDVVMASLPAGVTYQNGYVMWTGDIPAGGQVSFTFQATINEAAPGGFALINPVWVEGDTPHGMFSAFDSALTMIMQQMDLYLPFISNN